MLTVTDALACAALIALFTHAVVYVTNGRGLWGA